MTWLLAGLTLLRLALTPAPEPAVSAGQVVLAEETYPLYPSTLHESPNISSPVTADDGSQYVVGLTTEGRFTVIPVTVENDDSLDYRQHFWYGKGRQLAVDSLDFPTLAATGRHADSELRDCKSITGKPTEEITRIGRPDQSSGAGFLAEDEDILSVLRGDNQLVGRLGLTHPELAQPLFHVFNVIQTVMKDSVHRKRGDDQRFLYNGKILHIKFWGAKGWQESIFNDEILGYWQIEIRRELSPEEQEYLTRKYSTCPDQTRAALIDRLSYLHTGEMVPFYIMRYGFYEGHTDYRADPIAIASIFGLLTVEELDRKLDGGLDSVLFSHYVTTAAPAGSTAQ